MSHPLHTTALLGCSAVALMSYGTAPAHAAPSGASFDPAAISVAQNGSQTTVVQTTSRAVVDWQGFDVRSNESVAFQQPDSRSAILNRVHSTGASQIDGAISAPGRVIIQNANGVMFSGTARVDVGSLVATTLKVDERQFLDSGRLVLGSLTNPDAMVANAGQITAADKGLVALIGGRVSNTGYVQARLGTVALAAGAAATIDFDGDGLVQIAITDPLTQAPNSAGALVANSGRISADGGSVLLSAHTAANLVAHAINLEGVIEARGIEQHGGTIALVGGQSGDVTLGANALVDASGPAGGSILLTGANVALTSGARVNALGTAGNGGAIRIGGDYRGSGTIPHAQQVNISAGAALDASATGGNGGSVIIWSDKQTVFDGSVRVDAAGPGAAGGFVETSSAGWLGVGGNALVSTAGTGGLDGSWLLDPDSIRVIASGGTALTPPDANGAVGTSTINASAVVAALASGKVQLVAKNLIGVEAPIIATSLGGSPKGLELIAGGASGTIRIDAPILLQDGNLALRAVGDIVLGTNAAATDFSSRAIIAVGSGTVWMQSGFGGTISQASNSAILATNIALIGGSVNVGSTDNFTRNVAGTALNGTFLFRESSTAAAADIIGTVIDPFASQQISGVTQNQLVQVGTQQISSTVDYRCCLSNPEASDLVVNLSAGGNAFDTVIFSALPYTPTPPANLTDSSDHFIRALSYTIDGTSYSFTPETLATNAPAGFALSATGGVVFTGSSTFYPNQMWGVLGFSGVGGTDTNEINFDPINQVSEQLIAHLGGSTTSVAATYRQFFVDDFNGYTENAQADFYRTTTSAGTVQTSQAILSGTVAPASRTYGDANPTFTFQSGPTSYLAVDSYVASHLAGYALPTPTIVTNATQLSSVGSYDLTVQLAPSSTYVSDRYTESFTNSTLQINPAPLTIISDNFTKVYGDSDPAVLTYGVTGLKNNELASVVLAGAQARISGENVGNYAVSQGSLASNSNYVIASYTGGNLAITPRALLVTAHDADKIYGDSNPSWISTGQNAHFNISGYIGSDATTTPLGSVDFSTPATLTSNVGTYAITPSNGALSGPAAGNYTLSYADGTLHVQAATLTVQAEDQTRLYQEPNPPLTSITTGWKNGDNLSNSLNASLSTTATLASNVGDYPITVDSASLTGPAAGNYIIVRRPGTLVISPAPLLLVSADDYTRVYGTANPAFTYQVNGWRGNDEATNSVNATLTSSGTILSSVGDYAIIVSNALINGPAAGNYTIRTFNGTLTITPAPLTVTADSFSKIYGSSDPMLTYGVEGLLNNDLATTVLAGALQRASGENVGAYTIGQGGLSLVSSNYTLDFVSGRLSITPAPLLVTANSFTRLYGDADPAFTYSVSGLKFSDTATGVLTGGLLRDPGENVGDYAIRQGGLGLTSGNYTLTFINGALTITPAPLLVTANNFSKVYGDNDPAFTYAVSGLRLGDTAGQILSGDLDRDAGENVGSYAIREGSLQLSSLNYMLTYQDGALRITAAPLIVSAIPNGKSVGELDPILEYTVDGLKRGDTIDDILSGTVIRAPGEAIGTYPIGQGTINLHNPNYELTFVQAPFNIAPFVNPESIELGSASRWLNRWRFEDFWRGRDPDTPGDAVYRTTRFENPYIPDPWRRAYGLGGVTGEGGTIPVMLTDEHWTEPDNDHTGQHADRSAEQCTAAPLAGITICAASNWLSDFWWGRIK
ncbi:MAG TPA: MBG domain-containing protein [Sphingobium sp.]|uniref:MBG domain-containing protein n=1 Tax=Sphingobium sp. TaxID=1912891 RepID=UPI002ED01462